MCGISGLVSHAGTTDIERQVHTMVDQLRHRGPDQTNIWSSKERGVVFGHNRLSIIDLSDRAAQPMINDNNGDVICYNGEIYNYQELRKNLQGMGHSFRSDSDTEVLLRVLQEWGLAGLNKLRGIYAFAYWQAAESRVVLVRDPMGVKPLYYCDLPSGDGFAFASEIKALMRLDNFNRKISRSSLRQFLEFGYTFDRSNTIIDGVRKIPPGCFAMLDPGRSIAMEAYYYPEARTTIDRPKKQVEKALFETLDQVVKQQLVSDVPVGLLLSGGLDSSILTAIAARHARIRTFSFGFADSYIDERDKAKSVSEFVGTDHQSLLVSPDDVISDLDSRARHMDDLIADWGVFSTQLMYRKCRERGIKVVLVGEGADELFGGYRGRFAPGVERVSAWETDWTLFKMYRRYAGRRYGRAYFPFRKVMRDYLEETDQNLFRAIQLFETREQLSNNFVMKVDKASMAESVEARVPYLDTRITNVAYRIPREMLLPPGGQTKAILGSMAIKYGLLPDHIVDQPKFGIGLPPEWIESSETFRNYASGVVLDRHGWAGELGLERAMHRFFCSDKKGNPFPGAVSIFRNLAWKILILNLWANYYDIKPG